jgi:hypothetical protein
MAFKNYSEHISWDWLPELDTYKNLQAIRKMPLERKPFIFTKSNRQEKANL